MSLRRFLTTDARFPGRSGVRAGEGGRRWKYRTLEVPLQVTIPFALQVPQRVTGGGGRRSWDSKGRTRVAVASTRQVEVTLPLQVSIQIPVRVALPLRSAEQVSFRPQEQVEVPLPIPVQVTADEAAPSAHRILTLSLSLSLSLFLSPSFACLIHSPHLPDSCSRAS